MSETSIQARKTAKIGEIDGAAVPGSASSQMSSPRHIPIPPIRSTFHSQNIVIQGLEQHARFSACLMHSDQPSHHFGGQHVPEDDTAPLSTQKTPTAPKTPLATTLSLIPKFRQYPLGAMLGLVAAPVANYIAPELTPDGWMQAPFTLSCVAAGMLIERSLHYLLGWYVDPRIEHLIAANHARIQLAKLREYEKAGVISQLDAGRIAAHIARRDIAGGMQQAGKPRGPYRKRTRPGQSTGLDGT